MKSIIILCIVLMFAGCGSSNTTASTTSTDKKAEINSQQMLRLVNDARRKGCNCGSKYMPPVPAVKWNNDLGKAAQLQSNNMYSKKYFDHISPDKKSTPLTRLKQVGYEWARTAENIAAGQTTTDEVVKGWLLSAGHCQNIMNPNYTEMGAAVKGTYWTQVFGTPKPKKK